MRDPVGTMGTMEPGEPLLAEDADWPRAQPVWQRDVTLEIWVDEGRDPVRIRLAGELNDQTSKSLVGVMKELLLRGARNFEVETSLHIPEKVASDVVDDLRFLAQGCLDHRKGVNFTWNGW